MLLKLWTLQNCRYDLDKRFHLIILTYFHRELFFSSQWATAVEKHKSFLDPDDIETVETFKSWDDVQQKVLNGTSTTISAIRPSLGYFCNFTNFFEAKLGPKLDASFLWGILACLLQASHPKH